MFICKPLLKTYCVPVCEQDRPDPCPYGAYHLKKGDRHKTDNHADHYYHCDQCQGEREEAPECTTGAISSNQGQQ